MVARGVHRRAARPAFTLVELTVVVLIVAVLAAVATPRYASALANYRADAAAGRIASDLRMICLCARRVSQAQTVAFNVAANTYTAATITDPNRRGTGYTVNLGDSDYLTDITSASFGGSASVQFDIYGRPNAAGTVVVQAGTQQRTVELDGGGNVRIY